MKNYRWIHCRKAGAEPSALPPVFAGCSGRTTVRWVFLFCGALALAGCTLDHSRQKLRAWGRAVDEIGYRQQPEKRDWVLLAQNPLYIALADTAEADISLLDTSLMDGAVMESANMESAAVDKVAKDKSVRDTAATESGDQPPTESEPLAREIQQALYLQLGQYYPRLTKGEVEESQRQAIQSASNRGIPYMVYPLLREHRDSADSLEEYSEAPLAFSRLGRDRLRLQLLLYDTRSRRLLDSTLIDSRHVSFNKHRHTPQDLLPEAFSRYARSLNGR